jgi:HAMP domain-containing protein
MMCCLVLSLAVLLLAMAGVLLMCGWKSGASQLARISIALVIGSTILSWFVDVLRASFARPGVATVAGGFTVLLLLALILLAVGWFFKRRSEAEPSPRPTIRRRVQLMEPTEDAPQSVPAPPKSSSTDDLHLFGGGQ